MDRKQFTKIMQELVSLKSDEENLNQAFKRFEPDFNYICFSRHETLIVKCLEFAMQDKNNWISYWLYDCDCGKNNLKVTNKHGKRIPLKTISNLYNLIKNKNV